MTDLKSLWENHSADNHLLVKTRIETLPQFFAFAATNQITNLPLFVLELPAEVREPDFKTFHFRGLRVEVLKYNDLKELNIYLLDDGLKSVFYLLIENVVEGISQTESHPEALIIISNIVASWKRLFDRIGLGILSEEKQKGLIGELLFLQQLIEHGLMSAQILSSWTGPDFFDKDFLIESYAFEIKFTNAKIPQIRISSERQLDIENFSNLYLVLYHAEEVRTDGFTLKGLIEDIRKRFSDDRHALQIFNDRLTQFRYYDDDNEHYNTRYELIRNEFYNINRDFPKITRSDLPPGINNVQYHIDLMACEPFTVTKETISDILNLCKER
jgi:hypothetical protein